MTFSLLRTDNLQGPIFENISSQMEAIVFIILEKWGISLAYPPVLAGDIFSRVRRLDKFRAL